MQGSKWWTPFLALVEFLIHVVVGTLIFGVIALPALGLNLGVAFLRSTGKFSAPIIFGLEGAEYLLFIVDLLLFVVFILRSFWCAYHQIISGEH